LFWKVQDDVKEGHREADEGKMKEFRGIVRYVNGAFLNGSDLPGQRQ
jgi:hypothetical protein